MEIEDVVEELVELDFVDVEVVDGQSEGVGVVESVDRVEDVEDADCVLRWKRVRDGI